MASHLESNSSENYDVHIESACKKNMAYDPGTGWMLEWADNFDKGSIDTENWNLQIEKAGRFNDEWQRYTNSNTNAFIDNSCLVIRAIHHSNTHGMDQYSSARLNTAGKRSWKYGKIAARIKLPHGEGIWPALWMLGENIDENGGDTPWPYSGEIDIFEFYGSRNNAVVEANMHYAGINGAHTMMGAKAFRLPKGSFADEFHIFELEWDEKQIVWSVDGKEYAAISITGKEFSAFHEKFFLLLNIAVGGKEAGRPDSTTPFPVLMYIDWIRVFKKDLKI